MSTIDVTRNVFFERLCIGFKTIPLQILPHPHCSLYNYFSISVQLFQMSPLIFVSTRFTK